MRRGAGRPTQQAALLAAAAALLAGCGTRLPDGAFPQLHSTAPAPVPTSSAAAGNTASDVGVTPTTVTVGIIVSETNGFDPRSFTGPRLGAEAFFRNLDANGGVHGRQVVWKFCDDHGQGPSNVDCVHQLIDTDHVFALTADAVLSYDGASYVEQKGVPDVGGQPIDVAYDTYSHLWSLYGSQYPRDNKQPGFGGFDYNGTEVYRYFKMLLGTHDAAVVYYNQASSQRFAEATERGLAAEGYQVVPEQINFALPDWNTAVLDMKAHHVDSVYDTLDRGGNESLCAAMDSEGLHVKAKVTTTQSWVASVRSDYQDAPICRNDIYAYGETRNYEDTSQPVVAAFRAAVHRYGWDGPNQLSEWELEGWAAAQWLTDAMQSCAAQLTRRCVEDFMARPVPYTGHGVFDQRDFVPYPRPPRLVHDCLTVARWRDSADGGRGGWVTQPPEGRDVEDGFSCFVVPWIPYPTS